MKNKHNIRHKKAFTLIELLVVIAIISVLAAILFPVFARARENARRASCMSNLKQIGVGITMYTQDYDEHMPSAAFSNTDGVREFIYPSGVPSANATWYFVIQPYIKNYQIFNCPSADKDLYYRGSYTTTLSYSYNYKAPVPAKLSGMSGGACNASNWNCGVDMGVDSTGSDGARGANLAAIEDPSGTIAAIDGSTSRVHFYYGAAQMANEETVNYTGLCTDYFPGLNTSYTRCARARHMGTVSTLFVDGHVKAMPWKTILGSDNDPNVVKYWTTASNPLH